MGPCVGGTFADPHASWPALFPEGSLFHRLPYLLPNLVCAALLLASIVLGYFLLDETHPGLKAARAAELNRRANDVDPRHGELEVPRAAYVSGETPLHETSDALKRPAVDLRSQTYGTFGAQRHQQQQKQDEHDARHESCTQHLLRLTREKPQDADATKERANGIAFSRPILSLVVALSIFTAHSMAYDHLLPIFFEDARSPSTASTTFTASHSVFFLLPSGGLGLSLRAVGFIMAVNGAIALFVQAAVFPPLAACVGVKRLFLAVTLLHPLAYLVVPLLPLVPVGTASGAGSGEGLLYAAIYACLALRNLLSILLYPVLLILIKEAATATAGLHGSGNSSAALVIGRVNGLAASAGAACRMVAPPLFGWLYGVGARRAGCPAVAWWAAALLAGVGAVQGWWCVGRSWRRSGTANNRACGSSAGSDEEESVALLGDCNDGRAKALDDRDA